MTDNPVSWPPGVRSVLLREGYERAPVDIVTRHAVEVGPPFRQLARPSRREQVKGLLPLSASAYAVFEDWRRTTLGRSSGRFHWTLLDTETPRLVVAQFSGPLPITRRAGGQVRVEVNATILPGPPSAAFLSTLASLHKAAPASWPVNVPSSPRREPWSSTADDVVARAGDRGPATLALRTRQEGATEAIVIPMTPGELALFEAWFINETAFGVRDILFPVGGGTHLGCFASGYTVRPLGEYAGWGVSFQRYLEARP